MRQLRREHTEPPLVGHVVPISLWNTQPPCPGMAAAPLLRILAVPGNGGPWSGRDTRSVPQRLAVTRSCVWAHIPDRHSKGGSVGTKRRMLLQSEKLEAQRLVR